ncbi:MAG: hypothetical protein K2J32_09410 [Ruminococcus sp.]|nr:hypothetical protein [Ruminococcus sp.]
MKEKEDEIKKVSVATKPKPLKKLKPVPQNTPKKIPEPEKSTPEKKRIVIGELPDYDSWSDSQAETPAEDLQEEEKSQPEKSAKNEKPEKKGFFSRVKDLMYVSADDDEEPTPDEQNDDGNFTIDEMTENVPDTMDIVNEVLSEAKNKVPETEPETIQEPEPAKEPEKKSPESTKNNNNNNNNRKKNKNKKKKKKSGAGNSGKPVQPEKKPEKIPEPETEKFVDEPKVEEPEKEPEQENNSTETVEEETIVQEFIDDIPEIPDDIKIPERSADTVKNGKYNSVLVLLCVILAIIGVIAIINACISGGSSSDDKYRKAIYPAVITDISPFENPAELTDNQILSSAIWSVIIDNEKLSQYPQRVDNMAIIPAEDIENFAKDMFGEDIKELTHSTIVTADSKFYYNAEANSYSVDIKPYTFTYSPNVTSVSKKKGKYIVAVDYIAEHPEWMEDTVSKSVEFTLSKNENNGYKIDSMKEIITE